MYKTYDNYSVRVIVAEDVLIPEILCIGSAVASLSLPEPSLPREIGRALHFFRKKEVTAISRYFDILWERAVPIKIADKFYPKNLISTEKKMRQF